MEYAIFVCCMAGSLVGFGVWERICSAIAVTLASVLRFQPNSGVKNYAGIEVLGGGVKFGIQVYAAGFKSVVGSLSILLGYAFWAVTLSLILSGLFLLQEHYSETLVSMVQLWNDSVGPTLDLMLMVPFQLSTVLYSAIVPVWNFIWFNVTRLFYEVVVVSAIRDIDIFVVLTENVANLVRHSVQSGGDYILLLEQGCDQDLDICYDPGHRMIDLITPMGDLRGIAANTQLLMTNLCGIVSVPFSVMIYPFLDINFAKAVHNFVNSVLYTVVHVPIVTISRCKHGGGIVMCLPDFEPSFNIFLASLRSLGAMLDNWLDVTSVIVQQALGSGTGLNCDSVAQSITPLNISDTMFEGRQYVLVGLTEGLYAATDGVHSQYFNHYHSVQTIEKTNTWPIPVEVALGVAAVTFFKGDGELDDTGGSTTTMMGCQCTDGVAGMRIQCGLSLYEQTYMGDALDPLVDLTFDVRFHQDETKRLMKCVETEISVQSVRWPVTRFSGAIEEDDGTCHSSQTCSTVDAVVWVAPRCSSLAGVQQNICLESYNDAGCFPYCMAARRAGSAASTILLYNAAEWKNRVHLMGRDCGFAKMESGTLESALAAREVEYTTTGAITNGNSASRSSSETVSKLDILSGSVVLNVWDPAVGCVANVNSQSSVGVDVYTGYTQSRYRSLELPGQPFSYAGDTLLTTIQNTDGTWSTRVERLYGNEVNEFTIINVQLDFPSSAPALTQQLDAAQRGDVDQLRTPYAFNDEAGIRHPSVSTQSHVYYVVNPSTAMFQAFGAWCASDQANLQLQAFSSYGAIRLWAIRAYEHCPAGDDGRANCKGGYANYIDLPGGFMDTNGTGVNNAHRCQEKINMKVTSLQYLNSENIAIQYVWATLEEWNVREAGPYAAHQQTPGMYATKYYSPSRNQLSDVPFSKEVGIRATAEGKLCPAMRRFPQFGSMFTEGVGVVVNLLRVAVRLVVSMPAVVEMWDQGSKCTLNPRGHSIAASCGKELLSMDEVFDSVDRGNNHFWRTFSLVAEVVRDMGGNDANNIANILEGMGTFGHGTQSPMVFRSMFRAMKIPAGKMAEQVTEKMFPTISQATFFSAVNPIRMARWSYNLVTGWIVALIPLLIRVDRNPGDNVARREILNIMTNHVLDSKEEFVGQVLLGMKQGCHGISLMMGYSNPFASLVRTQCEAGALATEGAFNFFTSVMLGIPFAKCVCVDTAGHNFERYMLDNCYYFAPSGLRPFMMDLLLRYTSDTLNVPCQAIVDLAVTETKESFQPWFSKQYEIAEHLGNSLDYLLKVVDPTGEAGNCNNFASNPFVSVLTPEPAHFFNGCASTTACTSKCFYEFEAFESAKLLYGAYSTVAATTQVVNVESPLFTELDADAILPFPVLAMVHLSDCTDICHYAGIESQSGINRDSCMAIAGIVDSRLSVLKYCIPKKQGSGVRLNADQGWTVRVGADISNDLLDTVINVWFSDTARGDTLVLLRDNSGRGMLTLQTQFVTVHSKSMWGLSDHEYASFYGTLPDYNERLAVTSVEQVAAVLQDRRVIGIEEIYVHADNGVNLLPMLVMRVSCETLDVTDSAYVTACISFDAATMVYNHRGNSESLNVCPMEVLFDYLGGGKRMPVVMPVDVEQPYVGKLLLVPTIRQIKLLVLTLVQQGGHLLIRAVAEYSTGNEFAKNAGIAKSQSFTAFSNQLGLSDSLAKSAVMQGSIVQRFQAAVAQNTLSTDFALVNLLVTMDPSIKVAWLSEHRISIAGTVSTNHHYHSTTTSVSVESYQSCDRFSCLGCVPGLHAMCYAAQQCSIEKCIGSIVNTQRPLCNLGAVFQKGMESSLQGALGAWLIFVDMYTAVVKLSLTAADGEAEIRMESFDDAFFGAVCSTKDLIGVSVATFVSGGGSLVMLARNPTYQANQRLGGLASVDNAFNAEASMIMTGLTSFLFQVSLLPVFAMIGSYKTYSCGADSLFSIISTDGFSITVGRKSVVQDGGVTIKIGQDEIQDALTGVAGACMPSYATECLSDPNTKDTCFPNVVSQMASQMGDLYNSMKIEFIIHLMDSVFGYLSGVVTGMQDFAQVLDKENCHLPNYYMTDALKCACNDTAMQIPASAANLGAGSYAFWCSGTLDLLDAYGTVITVYNPYSFAELKTQSANVDRYFRCLASRGKTDEFADVSCSTMAPQSQVLDAQGVSLMSVLQRCRSNYVKRRWDSGAWVAYDAVEMARVLPGITIDSTQASQRSQAQPFDASVATCLLEANERSATNLMCLQAFAGQDLTKAFPYEIIEQDLVDANSNRVDACQIFTGPAKYVLGTDGEQFRECVTGYHDSDPDCKLPLIGWSVASKNRVPVVDEHQVATIDQDHRESKALDILKNSQRIVLEALAELTDFKDPNLDVVLFSTEGDALHQIFDCFVQGPYARVDFWSSGAQQGLPVPYWARDTDGAGLSRTMDLPCNGDKLQGDFEPPFTCGSNTRRSIIKYFVRDEINEGERGNSLTEELVQAKIRNLTTLWSNLDNLQCTCDVRSPHHVLNSLSMDCCKDVEYESDGSATVLHNSTYLSVKLAAEEFDQITPDQVTKKIIEKLPAYWKKLHTQADNQPFTKWDTTTTPDTWRWDQTQSYAEEAVRSGLFHTFRELMQYNTDEINYPFRESQTIWQMCQGLLSQIMFTMPLRQRANGDWTVESILHLEASKLEFDPLMDVNFDESTGLSMQERYVDKLLSTTYASSPLFWHHTLRYLPSESMICEPLTAHQYEDQRIDKQLQYQPLAPPFPQDLMELPLPPSIPLYGYNAFPIGAVGNNCLCGWMKVEDGEIIKCVVPPAVCEDLAETLNPKLVECQYTVSAALAVEQQIVQQWNSSGHWECPENDLSDSWGIIPSNLNEDWIRQHATDIDIPAERLLEMIRAGVGIGNIDTIGTAARKMVNPSNRVHAHQSTDGKSKISLKCSANRWAELDPETVATQMVNDLFPVAQGVPESQVTSTCLRMSIEYSKYRIMRMLEITWPNSTYAVSSQLARLEVWKGRCDVQLDLMSMCKSHAVFAMVPQVQKIFECPFVISDPYVDSQFYVTPGCLVYWVPTNTFYDPCQTSGCHQETYTLEQACTSANKIPFDARNMSVQESIGFWPVEFSSILPAENIDMLMRATQLVEYDEGLLLSRKLHAGVFEQLLREGAAPGYGNVHRDQTWGTSEGSSQQSTMYCDAMVDWWPEAWVHPVGYHVTVPCHSDDAGYRTFDSVFVVQRQAQDGNDYDLVRMMYTDKMLRDPEMFHSQYGGAGFCRKGNYGMPMAITNTLRVCTLDALDAKYDPMVPVYPRYGVNETEEPQYQSDSEIKCSESPYETPWYILDPNDGPTQMQSVGSVPMYTFLPDGTVSTQYPAEPDRLQYLDQTLAGASGDGWGDTCHEGQLLTCSSDRPCVALDPSHALECVRGVCVRLMSASQSCYSHQDCSEQGMMCTGDGWCRDPIYQIQNDFPTDVEFELYAEESKCAGQKTQASTILGNSEDVTISTQSYDMFGASPWENLPDVLETHGLCSHRNWYEFQDFLNPTSDSLNTQAGICTPEAGLAGTCLEEIEWDVYKSYWWNTKLPPGAVTFDSIWDSKRFRMQAHACDMDYMHVERFSGCAPKISSPTAHGDVLRTNLRRSSYTGSPFPRGTAMQTINRRGFIGIPPVESRAAIVAAGTTLKSGFLDITSANGGELVPCNTLPQCWHDRYTFNGHEVTRMYDAGENLTPHEWKQTDAAKCGMVGRLNQNSDICELDLHVLGFYQALCNRDPSVEEACFEAHTSKQNFREQLCDTIGTYDPASKSTEDDIDSHLKEVTDALNSLLNVIGAGKKPTQLTEYLYTTQCTAAVYEYIQLQPAQVRARELYAATIGNSEQTQSSGIHYFFKHTTKEIPFSYWVKCFALSGGQQSDLSPQGLVECDAWMNRISETDISSTEYDHDALLNLRRADGVIYQSQIDVAKEGLYRNIEVMVSNYRSTLNQPTNGPFNHTGTSETFAPTCHTETDFLPDVNIDCQRALVKFHNINLPRTGETGDALKAEHMYHFWDADNPATMNNNKEFPGVPSRCYTFADLFPTSKQNTKELNINKGSNNEDYMWTHILEKFTADKIKANMVKDIDPIAAIASTSETRVSEVVPEGFVVAEFHPIKWDEIPYTPFLPVYSGVMSVKNGDNFRKSREDIPCYNSDDVGVTCDDSVVFKDGNTEISQSTCFIYQTDMTLALTNYEKDMTLLVKAFSKQVVDANNNRPDKGQSLLTNFFVGPFMPFYCLWAQTCVDPPALELFTPAQKTEIAKKIDTMYTTCTDLVSEMTGSKRWAQNKMERKGVRKRFEDIGFMAFGSVETEAEIGEVKCSTDWGGLESCRQTEVVTEEELTSESAPGVVVTSKLNRESRADLEKIRTKNYQLLLAQVELPFYHEVEELTNKCMWADGPMMSKAMWIENFPYATKAQSDGTQQTGLNECMAVSRVLGRFNCHYYLHQGLDAEEAALQRWTRGVGEPEECNPTFSPTTLVTKSPVPGMKMECRRRHQANVPSKDLSGRHEIATGKDEVYYTLYYRMIMEMLSADDTDSVKLQTRRDMTTAVVKPTAHPMFQSLEQFDQFQGLDISALQTEDDVIDELQDCKNDSPIAPNYASCNADFNHVYDKLRQDVDKYTRKDGPVIVPAGHTLVWSGFNASLMMGTSIPAWSKAHRTANQSDGFVAWLLSTDRCMDGKSDAVCKTNSDDNEIQHFNPWLGGNFNPYENCDTRLDSDVGRNQEIFDSYCTQELCEFGRGSANIPPEAVDAGEFDSFYENMPTPSDTVEGEPTYCWSPPTRREKKEEVQRDSPDHEGATNLCFRKPISQSTCTWPQGIMGGGRGKMLQETNTDLKSLLYGLQGGVELLAADQAVSDLGLGLFMQGGNPIYFTEKSTTLELEANMHKVFSNNIQELGGHHIVVHIRSTDTDDGLMYVQKTPLSGKTIHTTSAALLEAVEATLASSAWREQLKTTLLTENVVIERLHPLAGAVDTHWSCPLKRIGFWNDLPGGAEFNPIVPSPTRSALLFGTDELDMMYGTRAHPTQITRSMDSGDLVRSFTSNGFCFCNTPEKCSTPNGDACGLWETIRSLRDQRLREVVDLEANTCHRQLDWPFANGMLRDGTATNRTETTTGCDVYDRLPKFKYMYNTSLVKTSLKTTLDVGGACHMGMPPTIPTNVSIDYERCRKLNSTVTTLSVRCESVDAMSNPVVTDYMLPIEKSKPPTAMVQALQSRRRLCEFDECTAPPDYMYDTRPITHETSIGLPYRIATARVIAADLKHTICGTHHDESSECAALLNTSAWQMSDFLDNFFSSPDQLLSKPLNQEASLPSIQHVGLHSDAPDQDLLWNGPWVACTYQDNNCSGSISQADYESPHRLETCMHTFLHEDVGSTSVELNLCDLNDRMDSLCRIIQTQRTAVFEANCLVTGKCANTEFVYSPGMYLTSNSDFARGTIVDFYERYGLSAVDTSASVYGSDLICPQDNLNQELRIQNENLKQHCASVMLEKLQKGLLVMRAVLHVVIKAQIYLTQMVFSLLRFVLDPTDFASIKRALMFWFNKLITLLMDTFESISDMMFDILFEGGTGEVIKTIIQVMCKIINLLMQYMEFIQCKVIKVVLLSILTQVQQLASMFGGDTAGIDSVVRVIHQFNCNYELLNCDFQFDKNETEPDGALPIPSRCWTDYIPTIDDSDSLSCSPADTCRTEAIEVGGDANVDGFQTKHQVCDSCPLHVDSAVSQFGCDVLTKQCTCNRRTHLRTSCRTNGECTNIADTTCTLVSDIFTGHGSGGLPCTQCATQSYCLINDGGSGIGSCACLLNPKPVTVCAADELGARVMKNSAGLCAVSTDNTLEHQTIQKLPWDTLAVAPCSISSNSHTYCYQVDGYGPIAVGLRIYATELLRRRLLSIDGLLPKISNQTFDAQDAQWHLHDEIQYQISSFDGWNETHAPCNALVQDHMQETSMSHRDLQALKNCIAWRQIANQTIQDLNMTHLVGHDYLLLSVYDFVRALSQRNVLNTLLQNPATAAMHAWQLSPYHKLLMAFRDSIAIYLYELDAPDSRNSTTAASLENAGSLAIASILRSASVQRAHPPAAGLPLASKHYVNHDDAPSAVAANKWGEPPKSRRRLLNSDGVQQYSSLTAYFGPNADPGLNNALADIWTQGPIGWPPNFEPYENGDVCTAGTLTIRTLAQSVVVLQHHYTTAKSFQPRDWTVADNLPKFPPATRNTTTVVYNGDYISDFFTYVLHEVLEPLSGINRGTVEAFFTQSPSAEYYTFGRVVKELIVCDFETTTICSKHTRNVFMALLVAFLIYLLFATLCNQLGLNSVGTLGMLAIPTITIYLAYGISPACFPQLPICMLDDVILGVRTLIPAKIDWPNALQHYDECLGPSWYTLQEHARNGTVWTRTGKPPMNIPFGSNKCLRSCAAAPLDFNSWEANVAWIACGISPRTCQNASIPYFPRFQNHTLRYTALFESGDNDVLRAYTFCNFFTLARLFPVVLVLIILVILVLSLLPMAVSISAAYLELLTQIFIYTHAGS